MTFPNSDIEIQLQSEYRNIAGVDEVGRGCIAGPVVAAAVIFPEHGFTVDGLNDSKKLSLAKRESIFSILESNVIYSIGMIPPEEIDKINILQATFKAMHIAIENLSNRPDYLLIDGNRFNDISIPYQTIVAGDSKSLTISAASIIAKVYRDRWVIKNIASKYPEYGFENHKGYGTKAHYSAIDKYGITPHHRNTFLRKYFSNQESLFKG